MTLLAGDIGGTHSRLWIADWQEGRLHVHLERRYRNADFRHLDEVVERFRDESAAADEIEVACLALAAPVRRAAEGESQQGVLTNLPWRYDNRSLEALLPGARVVFINDFVAVGWALPWLEADDTQLLRAGEPDPLAPCAALGAGSGLGTVIALPVGERWQVLASEGGHADFAIGRHEEVPIVEALWREFGHASWERILSGPGLEFLHRLLKGDTTAPPLSAPEISRAALEERDPAAIAALERFCALYGAQAGNLALTVLPFRGLYLAGGIAPQVLRGRFLDVFLARFLDKGRMRPLLEKTPLHLITSDRSGLLGAASYARYLRQRTSTSHAV
ncbi:MAG: glucokinase [Gammaproteobacteria bacterium]